MSVQVCGMLFFTAAEGIMSELQKIISELGTDFFKALSDPSRIQVLLTLAAANESCTVSRVAETCTVDMSVVSRHLAQLKRAGIVSAEKQGREVYYRLDTDNLVQALRQCADALERCCPGKGRKGICC
ncbi:MAG: ArsR family transcriptional regulator [Pseudomonadales bacterium]|nr:ArsR family transcriptional regulator [Pseudomonadales bacterium]